jgi:hypothetical protein
MTNKTHVQKKRFDCGHFALGQFCHLCKQVDKGQLIKNTKGKYTVTGE